MYIDETGTLSHKDGPRYFLLTGIIVHRKDIKRLKRTVFHFKHENFTNGYIESEIHLHDMFRSKNDFIGLRKDEKQILIENVYQMIKELPFTGIVSAIHKPKFRQEKPSWRVLKTVLIVLLARYNLFLKSMGETEKGIIRMDKSTDKQRREINDIFRMLRREKKNNQISNILESPYFVNSDAIEGIQVADAVSFCVGKKLIGNKRFPIKYWDLISEKLLTNSDGGIMGYGLNVFPHMEKLENEDIQP